MTQKIIAANWKMNKTNAEAKAFFDEFEKLVDITMHKVIFCVPYTVLPTVVKECKRLKFLPGAQNLHYAKSGTCTGEISADMLVDAGVKAVIAGHSERRIQFKESNDFINKKIKSGLDAGLTVILCVGETLEERERGKTNAVLKKQLVKGLQDVDSAYAGRGALIVAYEPVWAISGGDPSKPKPIATQSQIEEVHSFIKSLLKKQFGSALVPVLYGGSANDKNAAELFSMHNVDGVLVGGASLEPAKFSVMVNIK